MSLLNNNLVENMENKNEERYVGRPTLLTRELIKKAHTYLDTCVDNIIETEKGAVSYVDVKLPTVVDLALYLGINKATIYKWIEDEKSEKDEQKKLIFQEFIDIVNDIEAEQEKRLINKTIGGLYQPKTANMMLSKHGYSEKIQQELSNPDGNLKTIVINKYGSNNQSTT